MMHTNGLTGTAAILGGLAGDEAIRAFARHRDATAKRLEDGEDAAHPDAMGYGMVLAARGNVYGDERTVPAAKRRAKNRAARKARRIGRRK